MQNSVPVEPSAVPSTQWATLLDALREGVQLIDRDWRYVYLNASAAAHGRKTRSELLGRAMTECYPGIDQTSVFAALRCCMEQRVAQNLRNEFMYGDGLVRTFALRVEPVEIGIMVISDDVTEAVRAEEALRVSETRYRTLFEAAPEAIVTLDVETGCFVEANPRAERLFGYARTQLFRMNPVNVSVEVQADGRTSAEAAREYIGRALGGERPMFDWVTKNALGETTECEVRLVRLPGEAALVRASVVDISERRRAEAARSELEQALRNTELQLRQAQKMEAIGRLAGGVAHDFNNLLSVILGYASILVDARAMDDPDRDSLREILSAGERARELTRQLLAFGRKQVMASRELDLNHAVNALSGMLQRMIGEDVELSLDLQANGTAYVDPSQLEQVVMNLVVNARDAMPQGGKIVIRTADVTLDEAYRSEHADVEAGQFIMLEVTDTGCGMSRELQERIFEPFFTTKELGKGTGLGLSTVFGVVKQSGGSVEVLSAPGQGATFKLYLPHSASHAGEPPITASPPPAGADTTGAQPLRGDETVLLVEDNDQMRTLVCAILRRSGYRVIEAASGKAAVEAARQHTDTLHLLLTDVVMSGLSGREVAEQVTSSRPGVKVVFMSGYTDDAVLRHGVLSSKVVFIQKPVLPRTLLLKLREVLDGP